MEGQVVLKEGKKSVKNVRKDKRIGSKARKLKSEKKLQRTHK